MVAERIEESLVGLRIPERLARLIDGRDASQRDEDSVGGRCVLKFLGDDLAEFGILFWGGSHERDVVVVDVELTMGEVVGHGRSRAEIDHVERADGNDLRYASTGGCRETIGPCGEDATNEFVGKFGGGDVKNPGDPSIGDE